VDYLPHITTMTGPYYSELLKKNCVRQLRGTEGNADPTSTAAAPAHMSQVARAV